MKKIEPEKLITNYFKPIPTLFRCTPAELREYVRHQIHHPENTENVRFTNEELQQSIGEMREFIKENNVQKYECTTRYKNNKG